MLDALKKWMKKGPESHNGGQDEVASWAKRHQHTYRRVRDAEGFVVEGKVGATTWRIEWGQSQRPYIPGMELRLRAELPLPADLQALVLDRELRESMEREVFDQFVEDVQTRIDTSTPPEMRWLVMLPKLSGAELKGLRERFAAVATFKPWLVGWLEGSLGKELLGAPLATGQPLVLMVARGRLTLRTPMQDPDPTDLGAWLRVFECAIREAGRVTVDMADPQSPSTQPSLWTSSDGSDRPGPTR